MNYTTLCKYVGGSSAYGTAVKDSDIDIRGTYILQDKELIISPHAYNSGRCATISQTDDADVVYYEIRHFLHLLSRASSVCIEMLFNKKWLEITPEFQEVISNRRKLISPTQLHDSLTAYSRDEHRLAVGERQGKLGSKRREMLEKYTFSPKNFINALRLLYCGEEFFATGVYPVDMSATPVYHQLIEIRKYPERFSLERLNEMYNERLSTFHYTWSCCYRDIEKKYSYDSKVAAELMLDCYRKTLGYHAPLFDRVVASVRNLLVY